MRWKWGLFIYIRELSYTTPKPYLNKMSSILFLWFLKKNIQAVYIIHCVRLYVRVLTKMQILECISNEIHLVNVNMELMSGRYYSFKELQM